MVILHATLAEFSITVLSQDGQILLLNPFRCATTPLPVEIPERVWYARMSPDGQYLALFMSDALGNEGLYIANWDGSDLRVLSDDIEIIQATLGWSHDSRSVNVISLLTERETSSQFPVVYAIDVQTGARRMVYVEREGILLEFEESHDGRFAALLKAHIPPNPSLNLARFIELLDLQTGERRTLTDVNYIFNPRWSPNDQQIVYRVVLSNATIGIADTSPDSVSRRFVSQREPGMATTAVEWLPNGRDVLLMMQVFYQTDIYFAIQDAAGERLFLPCSMTASDL
jgi:Tol biopolymer transport system component